jgi:hypothetical protein
LAISSSLPPPRNLIPSFFLSQVLGLPLRGKGGGGGGGGNLLKKMKLSEGISSPSAAPAVAVCLGVRERESWSLGLSVFHLSQQLKEGVRRKELWKKEKENKVKAVVSRRRRRRGKEEGGVGEVS